MGGRYYSVWRIPGFRGWCSLSHCLNLAATLMHSQNRRLAFGAFIACLLSPLPPIYVSSISTMPDSISPSFLHASRKRCSINHADFCVMPNSLPICKDDTPLRAVAIRYMAIKPFLQADMGTLINRARPPTPKINFVVKYIISQLRKISLDMIKKI